MRCIVCGRKLKAPKSIKEKAGPTCRKKLDEPVAIGHLEDDIDPNQMSIYDFIPDPEGGDG